MTTSQLFSITWPGWFYFFHHPFYNDVSMTYGASGTDTLLQLAQLPVLGKHSVLVGLVQSINYCCADEFMDYSNRGNHKIIINYHRSIIAN